MIELSCDTPSIILFLQLYHLRQAAMGLCSPNYQKWLPHLLALTGLIDVWAAPMSKKIEHGVF